MSKNRWERTGNRPNWLSQPQRDVESERCLMVDLDGAFYCDVCHKIYLVQEEETYHGRDIRLKGCFIIKQIAEALDVPAYVEQVHLKDTFDDLGEVSGEEIDHLEVLRVHPLGDVKRMSVLEWQDMVMWYRDLHDKHCIFAVGKKWDKNLRHDVDTADKVPF